MTEMEFTRLYEKTRDKAVAVAAATVGNRDIAEEAVQEAAIYCLQRIAKQPAARFTASYFVQLAVSRAKDATTPHGRTRRRNVGPRLEAPLGNAMELDRAVYGPYDE